MDLDGLVRPVVEAMGLELVEVAFQRAGGRQVVSVAIDRLGGVDLDTITEASERIGRRLDLQGFAPGPYALEVGSPGLERPLRRPEDFAARVGQKVKVRTGRPVDGRRSFHGSIEDAGAEAVTIAGPEGEHVVPYHDITSARTVFEWGPAEGLAKAKGGKR